MENLREKIKIEKITPDEAISYNTLKSYIEHRKKESSDDLAILAEKYNLELKYLIDWQNKINEKIKADVIVTTYHLIPWEFYYYVLAHQRLNLLGFRYFNFPIYWGEQKNEKFNQLYLVDIPLDLAQILDIKNINKRTQAIDFYCQLKEKFYNSSINLKENLKNFLASRHFLKGFTENEKEIIVDKLSQTLKALLTDYFLFFEDPQNFGGFNSEKKNFENVLIVNDLGQEFLKDEKLKNLLKDVDLNQPSQLLFFICLLGQKIHLGAEWPQKIGERFIGKFNQFREKFGLKPLVEFQPGVFFERFQFTQPFLDSFTLKLIFGDSLENLIHVASIEGKKTGYFYPYRLVSTPEGIKNLTSEAIYNIRLFDWQMNFNKISSAEFKWSEIKEKLPNFSEFLKKSIINYINQNISEPTKKERFLQQVEKLDLETEFGGQVLTLKKLIEFIAHQSHLFQVVVEKIISQTLGAYYLRQPQIFRDIFKVEGLIEKREKTEEFNEKIEGLSLPLEIPNLQPIDIFNFILLKKDLI